MLVKPKATAIQICVLTSTWRNKAFIDGDPDKGVNFDNLTPEEVSAYTAAESALAMLNNAVPAQALVCPIDYPGNVQVIEKYGFGQNLPAILITGYYPADNEHPSGYKRVLPIANEVGGGKVWTANGLYPSVLAVYDNADKGLEDCGSPWPFSLIIPASLDKILCSVPAYLYLAAALYSGYKTYEQRKDPALSVVWGAALLFAGGRFLKSGGFKAIK